MNEDELKALKKAVSKKKRIAMEWASQIHDLVEDRFLSDYPDLTDMSAQAIQACKEYVAAKTELDKVS